MLIILAPTRLFAQHWLADQGARGAKAKIVYDIYQAIEALRGTRYSTLIVLGGLLHERHSQQVLSGQHFILYPLLSPTYKTS